MVKATEEKIYRDSLSGLKCDSPAQQIKEYQNEAVIDILQHLSLGVEPQERQHQKIT